MSNITILFNNIFKSDAEALVNPVNLQGICGKGLALKFKRIFPENYKAYVNACKNGDIAIGKLFLFKEKGKVIINFPTKTYWKLKSEYSYIETGLNDLINIIKNNNIKSIAIPALGCGCGELDWNKIKTIICNKLSNLDNINIYLYQPYIYPF